MAGNQPFTGGSKGIYTRKITPPEINNIPLHRSRLYQRLDHGAKHALTTVIAPAGYGKTSLLKLWAERSRLAVGWVSLDERDNDPHLFLEYLVQAVPTWPADLKQEISQRIPASPIRKRSPVEAHAVSPLILELQQQTQDLVIILDGFDRVTSRDIHQVMSRFLHYSPPHVHVVVSGRKMPPFASGKMSNWDFVAVNEADLALTLPEIAGYVLKNSGVRLNNEETLDVFERTRGWITGVNAVVSCMQRSHDYGLAEDCFYAQVDSRLAPFFRSQVIQALADAREKQPFATVMPKRISEALEQHLSGGHAPGIRDAAGQGLFLFPMEQRGGTFAHHPLFVRFLHKEMKEHHYEKYQALNRRCAAWLESRGDYVRAAECALNVDDYDLAARIIVGHPAELLQDENLPLLRLLEKFPESQLQERPVLTWMYAAVLIHSRRYLQAEQLLDRVDAIIAEKSTILPATGEDLRGYIASDRARIHLSRNEIELGLEQTKRTETYLGGPGRLHGRLYFSPHTTSLLNSPYGYWGALRSAKAVCNYCEPRWHRLDPGYAAILVILGECHYEEGDFEQAEIYLRKGLELGFQLDLASVFIPALITLAHIHWNRLDKEASYATLQDARDRLIRLDLKDRISLIDACEASFRIREDHMKFVRKWAARSSIQIDKAIDHHRLYESTVMLRALFALGRTAQARTFGHRLLQFVESNNFPRFMVTSYVIMAQDARAAGNTSQSLEYIDRAVKTAFQQGYRQLLIEEGGPLSYLLQSFINRYEGQADRKILAYAAEIVKALPNDRSLVDAPSYAISHLSRQEIRVFQLLIKGLSNKGIAEQLGISTETVKKHCRSIYHKLGVRNRREAAIRFAADFA